MIRGRSCNTAVREGGCMKAAKIAVLLLAATLATTGAAQSGRNLDELKAETQARADRNAYPLIGLKPDEVREALARLTSMDRDEWAASWRQILPAPGSPA